MNATQVAQKHGKSARWLNSKLDDMDVFNKSVKRVRVFKQWFIDSGLGQMKKTEMGYDQPLFTNRGEVWISERLSCDGEI
jgi:anti-repressor protein